MTDPDTSAFREHIWPAVALAALGVSLIVTGISFIEVQNIRSGQKTFESGVECLLEQQEEHRVASKSDNDAIRQALGQPTPPAAQEFGSKLDSRTLSQLRARYGPQCSRFSAGLVPGR